VAWSPDEVLAAVRAMLPRGLVAFERADLSRNHVLVVFRVDGQRFGVHYSLSNLPNGPNTGMPCESPEQWAVEIGWDINEQVGTGGVARAERALGPDGLVLLRWRW
jgi:hypothetical protein